MDIKIYPSTLQGEIDAVSSKSMAHRLFICSALSESKTVIQLKDKSKDIDATINCIKALGGGVERHYNAYTITPINTGVKKSRIYNAVESGSTLRFMLPIICALGANGTFIGEGRLPDRPITELTNIIKGCAFSNDKLPITVHGKMQSGEYRIKGNISSQYISGLMFSLPLLDGDSKIILTTPLESTPYVEMTIDAVNRFGVEIEKTEYGYYIKGNQKYVTPKNLVVEGDWSNSAFWIVATAIGNSVKVNGLDSESKQGDKKIVELTLSNQSEISVKEIPDLVPILSVLACYKKGRTVITDAERLRLKESDRLFAMKTVLTSLGGNITEMANGLIIDGNGEMLGGEVDGFNDHRIVMSTAILATKAKSPVVIKGAQAIEKSYPNFFKDFKKLGGKYDVL